MACKRDLKGGGVPNSVQGFFQKIGVYIYNICGMMEVCIIS